MVAAQHTSGVYTYAAWNAPDIKALATNRKNVNTGLKQGRKEHKTIKHFIQSYCALKINCTIHMIKVSNAILQSGNHYKTVKLFLN